MDAHLFRRICEFIVPALVGSRIEKIHQVSDGLLAFTLYGLGKLQAINPSNQLGSTYNTLPEKKIVLVFKAGKNPLLFFSDYRPHTNLHPPANVMRLRKYMAGRRIIKVYANWLLRKIYFEVSGASYICLDLRNGIEILPNCPSELENKNFELLSFGKNKFISDSNECFSEGHTESFSSAEYGFYLEPNINQQGFSDYWPDFEFVYEKCVAKVDEVWQQFPVVTPLLRRVFPFLDKYEASALYADLQAGGGDVVIYEQEEQAYQVTKDKTWDFLPFFLPEELENKLNYSGLKKTAFEQPYKALLHLGEVYFVDYDKNNKVMVSKEFTTKAKKLDKLLEKLDHEEIRLNEMVQKKQMALLMQANLYQLEAAKKEKSITLINFAGEPIQISLDQTKSISENMKHLFHQAKRGERGLVHLAERRVQIAEQKNSLQKEALQTQNIQQGISVQKKFDKITKSNDEKIRFNKGKQFKTIKTTKHIEKASSKFPNQVQVFLSSDGFTLLRGRDVKGNGLALKIASPFDYWVHTADGPSAHVIIRKNHPNQEVPSKTMQEAGMLAILKSAQKEQSRSLVQYSLVKYIRPMKNAKSGLVHIDKIENTYWVEVDKEIETKINGEIQNG